MTDIDLTEALEAAAHAQFEAWAFKTTADDEPPPEWDDLPSREKHYAREQMLPAVAAAAPLIVAAERERLAQAIEAVRQQDHELGGPAAASAAFREAARIVREGGGPDGVAH